MAAAKKKPAPATAKGTTWMECWVFLDQRVETLEIMMRDRPCEMYARDLAVARKLLRLVEIIQLLGAQFTELLRRNEAMLRPQPVVDTTPEKPEGSDNETDDQPDGGVSQGERADVP